MKPLPQVMEFAAAVYENADQAFSGLGFVVSWEVVIAPETDSGREGVSLRIQFEHNVDPTMIWWSFKFVMAAHKPVEMMARQLRELRANALLVAGPPLG